MKKLLLIALLFTPLVSLANNPCIPNLINEDVCKIASEATRELKSSLPLKITDTMKITEAVAEQKRIILTALLDYNKETLDSMVANDKELIDKIKNINKRMANKTVCSDANSRSFINLGGEIEYDFVFKDGTIYDIVTVTACYDNKGKTSPSEYPSVTPPANNKNEPFTLPKNRGWDIPLDESTKPTSKTTPATRVYPTPDNYEDSFSAPVNIGFISEHEIGVNPKPREPDLTFSDALSFLPSFDKVDGYNPFDVPRELEGYELFSDRFIYSDSPEETRAIKRKIDAQRSVLGIESPGQFSFLVTACIFVVSIFIVLILFFFTRIKKKH